MTSLTVCDMDALPGPASQLVDDPAVDSAEAGDTRVSRHLDFLDLIGSQSR